MRNAQSRQLSEPINEIACPEQMWPQTDVPADINWIDVRQHLKHLKKVEITQELILLLAGHQPDNFAKLKDTRDAAGRTPIFYAALGGHAQTIIALKRAHPSLDINAQAEMGENILHYAALGGHASAVSELSRAYSSLDINATSKSGRTVLHYAASGGHARTVEELQAEHRSLCVAVTTHRGGTLLHIAARNAQLDTLYALDQRYPQLNIDAMTKSGETVLHYAALGEDPNAVIALKTTYPALQLTAKNRDGLSILHFAAWGGHVAMVEGLIRFGLDPFSNAGSRDLAYYAHRSGNRACIALCHDETRLRALYEARLAQPLLPISEAVIEFVRPLLTFADQTQTQKPAAWAILSAIANKKITTLPALESFFDETIASTDEKDGPLYFCFLTCRIGMAKASGHALPQATEQLAHVDQQRLALNSEKQELQQIVFTQWKQQLLDLKQQLEQSDCSVCKGVKLTLKCQGDEKARQVPQGVLDIYQSLQALIKELDSNVIYDNRKGRYIQTDGPCIFELFETIQQLAKDSAAKKAEKSSAGFFKRRPAKNPPDSWLYQAVSRLSLPSDAVFVKVEVAAAPACIRLS